MEISERKLGWVSAVVDSLMSKRWIPVLKSQTTTQTTNATDDKDNRYNLRKPTAEKNASESSEVNNTSSEPQAPRTNSIKEALKQAKKKK